MIGLSAAEIFSKGFGNLTNLISLGLDILKKGFPLDWSLNFLLD